LPPEDSFDWLATHYSIANGDAEGSSISGISEMLRIHSARQSFYQTIGRAKDPSAATPSVIYCYGMKKKAVLSLIGDFESPVILPKTSTNLDIRFVVGTHWRRTGELLDTTTVAAINYIEKKGRVKSSAMRGILNKKNFEYLFKNLSKFGIEYDTENEYLYIHRD